VEKIFISSCIFGANTKNKNSIVFMCQCTFLIYIVSFKYIHNANHIMCSFIQAMTSSLCHMLFHSIDHIVN